jgi:hypothetical protein
MSFWCYKRDKSGKKMLWQIDYDPMIFMVVIGLLAALVGPQLYDNPKFIVIFPFLLMFAGLICLIIAKISLYRKGIWKSFGTKHMSLGYAALYQAAYILMTAGIVMLGLLLTAIKHK